MHKHVKRIDIIKRLALKRRLRLYLINILAIEAVRLLTVVVTDSLLEHVILATSS